MARPNDDKNTETPQKNVLFSKKVSETLQQINSLLGKSNLQLYGTDRTSDIDSLNSHFYDIMQGEVNRLTNNDNTDTTSFLAKLYSDDRIDSAKASSRFTDAMNGMGGGFGLGDSSTSAMSSFLDTVYQNKLVEQSDLHQVSTQLIELQEAISITRDAIITPDIVEGRMNRSLHFNGDESDDENYKTIVEQAEQRFKLLEKIKNFIVPYALEYGNYYVYTIPYSKLFSDLVRNKRMILNGANQGLGRFGESVCLTEAVNASEEPMKRFEDRLFLEYMKDADPKTSPSNYKITKDLKEKFTSDVEAIMERIEICNDPTMALPFLEEGVDSILAFGDHYMREHGMDGLFSEADDEKQGSSLARPKSKKDNPFDIISKTGNAEGIYSDSGKQAGTSAEDFSDIKDVYIRMLEPTKIIPVEIIDEPIGYYLVIAEESSRLNGLISDSLTYQGINGYGRSTTFIDEICEKIIRSFDKPFLQNNAKFKRLIVQAVNYYNLNNNRIRFQFIPAEYIQEFKVDVDENGHGQSMVRKSLFYAKMYLMLLMFKIFSIVKYSNDTHVNYVKQSGLRKDVANKVQEIIRRKQSRTVNMYDLYNYSTLINKIGAGSELYIPIGKQGERPVETEILSGQDVQLNSDLLEMLKNAYILGTGVPAAIVNYLNEPEFAKVAEQNNSKWNARVVNYQLDFNPSITEWYKKILRWSTNIPEEKIEQFEFTLQAPKMVAGNTRTEMFQQAQQMAQSVVALFMGENIDQQDISNAAIVRELTISVLEEQFPTLNVTHLKELYDEAVLRANQRVLRPDVRQGDNGEDLDLGDLEKEFQ